MDKKEIINKLTNNNKNIKYSYFCNIVESFGFVCKRRIYAKIGVSELINIQNVNGEVKPYQVKQFLYIVRKYGLEE